MSGKYALCIGINSYKGSPLTYCVHDAEEVAQVFNEPEYMYDVATLYDNDATRSAIFDEVFSIYEKNPDLFVFYFSGHGAVTRLGTYLVSVDYEKNKPGVEIGKICQIAADFGKKGVSTVIILDCCHAGGAHASLSDFSPLTTPAIEREIPGRLGSVVVLAASQADQYAFEEPAFEHSAFSYYLIDGFLGAASDYKGRVTPSALYEYVADKFSGKTTQNPVFKADIPKALVIGEGFPCSGVEPISSSQEELIINEAEHYVDDFVQREVSSLSHWKREGYKESCAMIEPLLLWFKKQISKHPNLLRSQRFENLRDAANTRLAQLGSVDVDTVTPFGRAEKKLGEGGFGVVWRVVSESSVYAFKIYHPGDLSEVDKLSRFERGYRAMKKLDHARVVGVYQYSSVPVGFVMDYVDGPNLRELGIGSHDKADIMALLIDVAETVRHAHSRDVVHRDIKPENILMKYVAVENRWIAHLTDFDLAWFPTASHLTVQALGTVHYAAPEQLAKPNSRQAREKAVDVFSFGQLLFFAITGSDPVPYDVDENKEALRIRVSQWGYEKVAIEVARLYEACTQVNPSLRPENLNVILDGLRSILSTIKGVDEDDMITDIELISEIIFSLVGLDQELAEARSMFVTPSGRTRVSLEALPEANKDGVMMYTIKAHFEPITEIKIDGSSNYDHARRILNWRIDSALTEFKNRAVRKSGTQGTYECYVNVGAVPGSHAGARIVPPMLARVIGAIESA